ncbi:efflux RND transporter periplasmic adaptor subunit [Simiduia sp. 21SJ11W-1]|uniref:efflux RND transporter periplasmic adaptor subunit n=1 Tax=Simiduia sp. 21SJ11W-1 TaxID=2909669 RepID=UPI00209EC278|nr:efflux RND transporter periplasmic adaptor subunit [Simiduia sp. 21SJ11W-1]UTA48777.1 efflux RND transporter periplasmic adaptor subunit [Simiduia sp. 21SJ11W-1]
MIKRVVRRYWVFAPVLAVALALLVSTAVRSSDDNSASGYLLKAASQKLQLQASYSLERRFAGRVAARQDADVGFELGGRVANMRVNDGDRVRLGDVLATLDTELLVTERSQLQAQLADNQARLQLNLANTERHQSLQASGFASQQRLDELLTEQKTLAASGDALRAALENVDSRLRKATLRAPYEGVVARRFADVGTVVGAGSPVIRLQEVAAMEAEVGVPVDFALSLAAGQQVSLLLRGERLEGRLLTVGADVNPVTNTVTVRALLPSDARAFNGDIIQLLVNDTVPTAGFWIPADAITDGVRGRWTVYALVAEPQAQRVEARDVQIHHARADRVFVTGALADGETIVAAGVHRLVPGQQVALDDPVAAPQLGQTLEAH